MLLGSSIQIKEINETIRQVAPTDVSILITGESGVGKEVVANALHRFSNRKNKPFIIVNCGAIPEGIIESELFGHVKGAFTGAIDDRQGYFEMSDKGTIFLDEIGELPLATQVKFLRVLETGEFLRVGGNRYAKVDVRVIAATNRDLQQEVLNKNFREDLYYRLRSINIFIPPLRERKSDIKILFDHFIESYCNHHNIKFTGIDEEAMDFVINYNWPGNARELKNFCESIIVLNPGKKLSIDDVKKHLNIGYQSIERSLPMIFSHPQNGFEFSDQSRRNDFIFRALAELKSDIIDVKNLINEKENRDHRKDEVNFLISKEKMMTMTMNEIEKEVLTFLLNNNYWDIDRVANILEETPRNVYRKIKKYGLKKEFKIK
jgi:DNA-binding NtrC family response regulator